MPGQSRLPRDQEALLLRTLIAVAMRRLGVTQLDIPDDEFNAKDKGNVSLICRIRPGGGFIVDLTDNVQIVEHN